MSKIKRVSLFVIAIAISMLFSFASFAASATEKDTKNNEQKVQTAAAKSQNVIESFKVYVYGKETKDLAEEKFQTINECVAWIKGKGLNGSIYSGTDDKKLVAVDLEGCEINISSSILRYNSKNLKFDPKILAVQKTLNSLGYKLKEDGLFGKHTYDDIKLFQKSVDIDADGVIGEKTFEKLASTILDASKPEKK